MGSKAIESKVFRISIIGAFLFSMVITVLILFMIANFLYKINFLEYRFDDGELKPPIETIQKEDLLN